MVDPEDPDIIWDGDNIIHYTYVYNCYDRLKVRVTIHTKPEEDSDTDQSSLSELSP